MTKNEKIRWLLQHAPAPYARAKAEAIQELDDATPVFCFCGKLATGLHTTNCRMFKGRLQTKIIERLNELLPKQHSHAD